MGIYIVEMMVTQLERNFFINEYSVQNANFTLLKPEKQIWDGVIQKVLYELQVNTQEMISHDCDDPGRYFNIRIQLSEVEKHVFVKRWKGMMLLLKEGMPSINTGEEQLLRVISEIALQLSGHSCDIANRSKKWVIGM